MTCFKLVGYAAALLQGARYMLADGCSWKGELEIIRGEILVVFCFFGTCLQALDEMILLQDRDAVFGSGDEELTLEKMDHVGQLLYWCFQE